VRAVAIGERHINFMLDFNILLAHFSYFENIKAFLCMCVYPPVVAKQRLGKSPLIVARQWLGKKTLIIARQRPGKNPLIVARKGLGKNPPIVARQRLGRNVTAVANTHATI
jgi:hypothetical protein